MIFKNKLYPWKDIIEQICNYSVPKVAIKNNAFKTFCPALTVVSITDLRTANPFAPLVDLK